MQTILPVAQAAWVLLAGGVIRADTHELVSQSHDAVPGSKSAVSMAYRHVPIACQATSGVSVLALWYTISTRSL